MKRMKRISVQIAVTVLVLLLFAGGTYSIGFHHGEQQTYVLVERIAVDKLAAQLYVLSELDKGNTSDVRNILQSGTGPQLDWIMDHGDLSPGADSLAFRCTLFRRLKAYRDDHPLFKGGDLDELWKVPDIKEAEERRENFLNKKAPVICNWKP